jgi:hypothetical protein
MLLKRATASFSLSYLLLHAILGESNQIFPFHFKLTNTRYSIHLLNFSTSKLPYPYSSNLTVPNNFSSVCITHHLPKYRLTKSSNTTPNITSQEHSSSLSQHASTTTIPLNVDPVTTVFPDEEEQHSPVAHKKKSKKKTTSKSAVKKKSTSTSEKRSSKPKKGESKISLTMEDLYLKENPFNLPHVDSNVESSGKETKDVVVETLKGNAATDPEEAFDTAERSKGFEKGKSEKTLNFTDDKTVENLRVDDKNGDDSGTC